MQKGAKAPPSVSEAQHVRWTKVRAELEELKLFYNTHQPKLKIYREAMTFKELNQKTIEQLRKKDEKSTNWR
jgi:hypothetical protein